MKKLLFLTILLQNSISYCGLIFSDVERILKAELGDSDKDDVTLNLLTTIKHCEKYRNEDAIPVKGFSASKTCKEIAELIRKNTPKSRLGLTFFNHDQDYKANIRMNNSYAKIM